MVTACHQDNVGSETGNRRSGKTERSKKGRTGEHRRSRDNSDISGNSALLISSDTLILPEESMIRSKLNLRRAESREYILEITTTGVVNPLPGHLAEISSPFEGRIIRSLVSLGQKVNQGTPLFEVSSSDYLESMKLYMEASHKKEIAEKNYHRKRELLDSGIGSGREYEEALLEYELSRKELEKAGSILNIFNIDPEKASLIDPLIVRSPIRGEVVSANIIVGQYLRSDSDPVITVADLDKVWIVARVREKELDAIASGDYVEVFTENNQGRPVTGSVGYIGKIMNEETRSVDVYIEVDNSGQHLRSGMFVTVRFHHNLPEAIIIPGKAVLQDNDKSFLYVQHGDNLFVKQEVTLISIPDHRVIVSSGLEPGSIIVSEGGIYLR